MKWLFFVANSSKVLRAGCGNVGGSKEHLTLGPSADLGGRQNADPSLKPFFQPLSRLDASS